MKPVSSPHSHVRRQASNADSCCGGHGHDHGPAAAPLAAPVDALRARFRIDKMDCPTEEGLIRHRLAKFDGIARLDFNLLERELTIFHHMADVSPLVDALNGIGMAPRALADDAPRAAPGPVLAPRVVATLAVGGVAAAASEALAWIVGSDSAWQVVALACLSLACVGLPVLKKGWIALRHLSLNIFFLMSIAVAGAIAIGKWPEAAMVVFLFALAETIEALSLERARHAIAALTGLAPETAELADGAGWADTPVARVPVGSRIRVRAGARVPLDALVAAGQASVDQAPVTGESMPVDKQPGAILYAGSVVMDGSIEATTTRSASESTLARIAAAIQSAQAQRAPTQRMVDQFARYYTPAVVVLALACAVFGPLLTGGAWLTWTYQALVMLVIACPCALVVSTPVAIVSAMAAAARMGIVIKGGAFLESGRRLDTIAFDKTGTLTVGEPSLTDIVALSELPAARCLRLAASLNEHSTHPIAMAVAAAWRAQKNGEALEAVSEAGLLLGRGARGRIDGQLWHIGNLRLMAELGADSAALASQAQALERTGKTAIVLCGPNGPVALFGLADTVRPASREAVAALKARGIALAMLTGDNADTARAIAGPLGIDDVRANLLPEEKLAAVAEMAARGSVAMVGDGVNDAPALASAAIGIAIGSAASAAALETADVAILDSDLRKIDAFIGLSQRCGAVLKQNIALALGIKLVFLVLAVGGHATLWMAVFADVGASLIVVANGLRLLHPKP